MLLVSCWGVAFAPRPAPTKARDFAAIRKGPVGAATAARRELLVGQLDQFIRAQTGSETLATLARGDLPLLSTLTREFGFQLFETQRPAGDLRDVLLGVQDSFGFARPALVASCRVIRTWEKLEPSEVRTPLPHQVLLACKAVALAWNWPRIALLLHLGFFCLLRPGELLGLRRSSILFNTTEKGVVWLLRIEKAKSWSRRARAQYAKLDEQQGCAFCEAFVKTMRPLDLLWPSLAGAFGVRLQALVRAVTGRPGPYTAGSLRTGGATYLFDQWQEDLPRLCWRGRWRDFSTVWHYVQELQSVVVMQQYGPEIQERIDALVALVVELGAAWVAEDQEARGL